MSDHFKNGISLAPIKVPEGVDFENLDLNEKRTLLALARKEEVARIQGEKVALICMGKVSLYETYEDAKKAQGDIPIDSHIIIPPGYKGAIPQATAKTIVHPFQ